MATNKPDQARKKAVQALAMIHKGSWTASASAALSHLSPQDTAFASALFYGCVERLATLDFVLSGLSKRGLDKLDVEVRSILECGLYQMFYMHVPASAAVNESVKLARGFGKTSAAGFVNGVLRSAARQYEKLPDNGGPDLSKITFASEEQRVCTLWSVSPAVAQAIMQALPDSYEAFLASTFSQGQLCLRVNLLRTQREALQQELEKEKIICKPGNLPGSLYISGAAGLFSTAAFGQGHFHVQGEASQYACANLSAQPGMKVVDLCAAPGGKTATLAQDMQGEGQLISCDIHESRLALIRENLQRLGIAWVKVLQNDAAVCNEDLQDCDRVLCDVPCSGLGVLAQKPDLRYAKGDNFAGLPPLQLSILETAARYVKPGGLLVYSTCTIRPEENEQVVDAFLENHFDFLMDDIEFAPKGAVLQPGMMTVLPNRTGLDGFFVARMKRL